MGRKLDRFVLLMWKNAVQQRRQVINICFDILVLIGSVIFLLWLRNNREPYRKPDVDYNPFCPVRFPNLCDEITDSPENDGGSTQNLSQFNLVYSPTGNAAIDQSMGLFKFVFRQVDGYVDEKDLVEHFTTNEQLHATFAAIVFDDKLKDGTELPDGTEVKIRFPAALRRENTDDEVLKNWRTNDTFDQSLLQGPRESDNNYGAEPDYYMEGFLALQAILTHFLIYGQLGARNLDDLKTVIGSQGRLPPMVKLQRFPHASWTHDSFIEVLQVFVGLFFAIAVLNPCGNLIKDITIEKEKQLKETMKMMGLPCWLHWTAWFVKALIYLMVLVLLMLILLKVKWFPSGSLNVFPHSHASVLLLFLLLYVCAAITFVFAVSVFFSKANTAAVVGPVIVFLAIIPFMRMNRRQGGVSCRMLVCLLFNSAIGFGFQLIMKLEATGEGSRWNNIFRASSPEDDLTLGHVMLMLIIDAFLFLFIALYVEAVFPGQYGVPKRWNFMFMYCRKRPIERESVEDPVPVTTTNTDFEKEPTGLEPGVQITNLRKVFHNNVAVRNLSLNMYQNQITVLLGHNGAGKTTTMSMLTGMYPPTSGTATVAGHDIITDMDGVRFSLGLCPQHNILFDDLTVKEHLKFALKLKGLKKKQVKEEVEYYIELLELKKKENAKSKTLSGGMKRKLCVAMAMCGHSKVVMLDEPTAGMDPSARRALWDLIQQQKEGRTILLTTHYMDEADLLGDRIAILVNGELQCCGSSFFLKKKYGTGYRLIMDTTDLCDPTRVTALLKTYIPTIRLNSSIGSELTYLLAEDRAHLFEPMLKDLENNQSNLGVEGYGMSLTTLEEVFLKVGADHGQELQKTPKPNSEAPNKKSKTKVGAGATGRGRSSSESSEARVSVIEEYHLLRGCKLVQNQFLAMFMKRALVAKRSWIMHLFHILTPSVILFLTLVKRRNSESDLPALALSLDAYKQPITLIENPEASDGATTEILNIYTDLLQDSKGDIEKVDSIRNVMLEHSEKIPTTVRYNYIVGASFKGPEGPAGEDGAGKRPAVITAWYNNDPLHSPPLALALALSTAYRYMLKKKISFVHHPLPYTAQDKIHWLLNLMCETDEFRSMHDCS